jgi:hypothetical protein
MATKYEPEAFGSFTLDLGASERQLKHRLAVLEQIPRGSFAMSQQEALLQRTEDCGWITVSDIEPFMVYLIKHGYVRVRWEYPVSMPARWGGEEDTAPVIYDICLTGKGEQLYYAMFHPYRP